MQVKFKPASQRLCVAPFFIVNWSGLNLSYSDKNSHKSDENDQVAETTLSTVEQSQSVKRLLDTERMYLRYKYLTRRIHSHFRAILKFLFRRPRDPDQIMVMHDVTTKFEVVDQNGDAIYYLVQADSCCSR